MRCNRCTGLCRRIRPLDVDRAFAEDGSEGADGGEDRGDDGTDDANRQRKLGHGPALLFDDNATDIPLVKQVLHGINELARGDLERFRERRLIHTGSYVGVAAPVHSGSRRRRQRARQDEDRVAADTGPSKRHVNFRPRPAYIEG